MDAGTLRFGAMESARTRWLPRSLVASLGVAGGSLLIAGSLLPWLSLYAGVDTIRGIDATNGRVLLGAGVVSLAVGLLYAARPSKQLQYALATFGFAVSGFAAWVLSQLIGSYQQLQGDPFVVASLGSGTFVALGGGLLTLGTILVPQLGRATEGRNHSGIAIAGRADARTVPVTAAIAFLVSAALIHLSVVGPHLEESTLYAAFFVGAAIAQLGAAMALTVSRDRRLLLAVAVGNGLVIIVWALSRTVGLPIGPTPGIAESVSVPDVLASLAEAVIVINSVALLLTRRPRMMERWLVGLGATAVCAAVLIITVVAIVGVQSGGG